MQSIKKFCTTFNFPELRDTGLVFSYHTSEDFLDADMYFCYSSVDKSNLSSSASHPLSERQEKITSIPFHHEMISGSGLIDLTPYLSRSTDSAFYRLLAALSLPKDCHQIYCLPLVIGSTTLAHWLLPAPEAINEKKLITSWENYVDIQQHYLVQDLFMKYWINNQPGLLLHEVIWRFSAQVLKAYTVTLPDTDPQTFCNHFEGNQDLQLEFSNGYVVNITYGITFQKNNGKTWSEQQTLYEVKQLAERNFNAFNLHNAPDTSELNDWIDTFFAQWRQHKEIENEHLLEFEKVITDRISNLHATEQSSVPQNIFQLDGKQFKLRFKNEPQKYFKFNKAGFAAIYVLISREQEETFFSAEDIFTDEDYIRITGKPSKMKPSKNKTSRIAELKEYVTKSEKRLSDIYDSPTRLEIFLFLAETYYQLHRLTGKKEFGLKNTEYNREVKKLRSSVSKVKDFDAFVAKKKAGYRKAHHNEEDSARLYNQNIHRNIQNFLMALDEEQELYHHLKECIKSSGGSQAAPFRYLQTNFPKLRWEL